MNIINIFIWQFNNIYVFYILRGLQGFCFGGIEGIIIYTIDKDKSKINLFNNTTPFLLPLLSYFYYIFNVKCFTIFINILIFILIFLIYFINDIDLKKKNYNFLENKKFFRYSHVMGISLGFAVSVSTIVVIYNKYLLNFISYNFYKILPLIIGGFIGILLKKNLKVLIFNLICISLSILFFNNKLFVIFFIISVYNFYFIFSPLLVIHTTKTIPIEYLKYIYMWKHIYTYIILWIMNYIHINIKYKIIILTIGTISTFLFGEIYRKKFLNNY
ncbi:hypothetical protein AB836_01365 [Rickettsiales bacterium (ex Bugula neritina AB1)]|nr:hypothetical protein AB836_01365 [Rickettsiales bacterium (ex Bugula neritina AB1)]